MRWEWLLSLTILINIFYVFTIDDLRHLMAVRLDLHNKFAEENEMSSFLISAKSGDQIKQAFYKIAALLAGEKKRSNRKRMAVFVVISLRRRGVRGRG
jgi:hypothetical protein